MESLEEHERNSVKAFLVTLEGRLSYSGFTLIRELFPTLGIETIKKVRRRVRLLSELKAVLRDMCVKNCMVRLQPDQCCSF